MPKVADFGLAKNVEQDEGQTPSGVILGTPSYMAPEQARGVKELTRATDVYALGAILYELLTGRPPFKAGTTHETMLAVLLDEPKSPRALRPDVPRVLEAVCLKCLEKDPTRRYATAAELADDLERWGRNEPTRARPEGRLRATWRWLRRYSKATLATAALLVVLLVLFLFPSSSPERRRKDALRDLAAGRPVTWLGEVGPPPWLHWAAGEDKAAASRNPRLPFALETLSIALAEMLPEIPSDRYRFRVQVKHDDAEADGTVGIYFGHQSYETPQGVEHYFFELVFSDHAPGDERLPLALRFRRYREGEGDKNNRKHLIRLKKVAVAPPHPGDSWHEITVEVTPARVRALDGDTLIGEVSTAELDRQIQAWLTRNAHERGAYPRFDPRSGLGLYIYRGAAQFRSAILDPNVEDR